MVQDASTSPLTVTFGGAPTAGNMLVAIVSHFNNTPAANTGWTQLFNQNGGAADGWAAFYKLCGVSESTTQTPCTLTTGQSASVSCWEVGPGVIADALYANTNNLMTSQASSAVSLGAAFNNSRMLVACVVKNAAPNTPTLDAALTSDGTNSTAGQKIAAGHTTAAVAAGAHTYTNTITGAQNFGSAAVALFKIG